MKNEYKINKKDIGLIGENVTCDFLKKRGYKIVDRNYLKKCGELDIVAEKDGALHFVEVKSKSCKILPENREKLKGDFYMPEENVNSVKIRKIKKTVEIYLKEREVPFNSEWFFHVASVHLNVAKRVGRVFFIENQVL